MKFPGSNKIWWAVFASGLLPLLVLAMEIAAHTLGANPIEAVHIRLGDWALRFLCMTLAITPLQAVTTWRGMADYRQLFGVYSWFYATLHLLAYLAVDHAWEWQLIGMDLLESRYMWFGLVAYVIIFLLGMTTSKAAKKALGRRWKKLHRWIYVASFAAVMHYFWQLKGNLAEPAFYLSILSFLMAFRLLVWFKNKQFSRLMIPAGRRHLS
jgi:sulfoxide reductase heme-binding subunit YedZ